MIVDECAERHVAEGNGQQKANKRSWTLNVHLKDFKI